MSASAAANPSDPQDLNAPTATIASLVPTSTPLPKKPIMGGIKAFPGYSEPWTGGKPLPDWSGLDPSNLAYNPNFIRSDNPKAASAYNRRQEGLYKDKDNTMKFAVGKDLDSFCKRLLAIFTDYGMDTICYRKDPDKDPPEMINILKYYPRLNKAIMLKDSSWYSSKFDSYDKANDSAAIRYLLNSLDEVLRTRIESKIKDEYLFADVLFVFLEVIRPLSADLFLSIEKQVESIHPQSFPGENIVDMVVKLRPLILQLVKARAWDSKKNIDLCRILSSAGGETNHEYQFPMIELLGQVKAECATITHLSNEQKANRMSQANVGWDNILEKAESLYNEQSTTGCVRWPPACNPKDSKAPPPQYGANLSQASPPPSGRNNSNGHQNSNRGPNPKSVPPSKDASPKSYVNGEPLFEKTFHNRLFQWCNKCNRWSTTHHSGTHVGKNRSETQPQTQAQAHFGLVPDPTIWLAKAEFCPPDTVLSASESASVVSPDSDLQDSMLPFAPHLHFFLGIQFLLVILNHQNALLSLFTWSVTSISQNYCWFCLLTVGEILHFSSNFAAPSFWLFLVFASTSGRLVLYYYDPVTAKEAMQPFFDRPTRRLHARHDRRQRKQYLRRYNYDQQLGTTVFLQPRIIHGRQVYERVFPKRCKGCTVTFLPHSNVGGTTLQYLDSVRRFQEARTTNCKPLSNHDGQQPHLLNLTDMADPSTVDNASAYLGSHVVLSHPKACQAAMSHEDTFSLIWDSGASMCITGDKRDFIDAIQPISGAKIRGIVSGLSIKGYGHVQWSVLDNKGKLRHLKLPAYYIPKAQQRLLSTSVFCKTYPASSIAINSDSWTIRANPEDPTQEGIDIFINPLNNLPTTTCFRRDSVHRVAANFSETISATHTENFNLSEPQKELLRWHNKLGHVGMKTVQFILRTGALATSESMRRLHTRAANLSHSELPKCAACQFGKQTSRPVPGKTSRIIKDRAGILSADQVQPGQRVFVDHFICSTRGRQIRGHGIRDPKSPVRTKMESYSGGCLFVDASTGFIHVEFQSHLSSQETIQAVESFEKHALDNGIVVQAYQSDNGSAFTSSAFRTHLQTKAQVALYSGAGSHHQNGKAERGIRTIMAMARTMLLHSAIHWSEVADPTLWALSVRHAVWIYNHIPNINTGLSPIDTWSKTRFPLRKLHSLHVWGCPTYVLHKKLADGRSLGRWQPRSQRCMNLGLSEKHSIDVPLVINLATGNITPQWNLVFDDWFTTISNSPEDLPDFNSEEWSRIFGTSTYHLPTEDDSTADNDPISHTISPAETAADSIPSIPLPFTSDPVPVPDSPNPFAPRSTTSSVTFNSPIPSDSPAVSTSSAVSSDSPMVSAVMVAPPAPIQIRPESPIPSPVTILAPIPAAVRKLGDHNSAGIVSSIPSNSTRIRKPTSTLSYDTLGGNLASNHIDEHHVENYLTAYYTSSSGSFNDGTEAFAQAFKASSKTNPDILSYNDAMHDYAKLNEWLDAALKEITQLESKDCWVECLKQEAYDSGNKVIPSTWVFRYKRSPAGDILKCKARICLRGDLMTDDSESYAPVVSWSTVRFFLVISIMIGWTTVSVDWANAFIQAKLKVPMYMQTPRGFTNKFGQEGCLRVTKSLYGSKFAPRNWYTHLRSGLIKLGLNESPIDKCLFYRKNLLLVLYVDDAGIAAPNKALIDAFVQELKDLGFDLDIEDNFSSYLGIGIEELAEGTRHMTQSGLIKKVIATTKLEDCNPNWIPTTQAALGSDPDGEPYDQQPWNYASVVGMLLYLSNNTRPDITFAVSQVARFTAHPKKSHAVAVKTIIRYLSRTVDKGIFFKPDGTYNLKTWVDADFAGLYGREPSENRNAARSRFGYIITFGGVPLIWKSQLISEICLSTLHAEYVGLANALRAMIPIRSLVSGILDFLELPTSVNPEILCKVFEDNQGAYLLATNQRLSVRTKYFCVKHHFFWSYVYHKEKNPEGWLVIVKCPTELMNADYMTKGLVRQIFEANRLRIQGW